MLLRGSAGRRRQHAKGRRARRKAGVLRLALVGLFRRFAGARARRGQWRARVLRMLTNVLPPTLHGNATAQGQQLLAAEAEAGPSSHRAGAALHSPSLRVDAAPAASNNEDTAKLGLATFCACPAALEALEAGATAPAARRQAQPAGDETSDESNSLASLWGSARPPDGFSLSPLRLPTTRQPRAGPTPDVAVAKRGERTWPPHGKSAHQSNRHAAVAGAPPHKVEHSA